MRGYVAAHAATGRPPVGEGIPETIPAFTENCSTGSVPSFTPAAPPGPHIAVLAWVSPAPSVSGGGRGGAVGSASSSTTARPSTRFGRSLTTHGASTAGSVPLHLPSRLRRGSRPRHLSAATYCGASGSVSRRPAIQQRPAATATRTNTTTASTVDAPFEPA
jgi:hypothetical protein